MSRGRQRLVLHVRNEQGRLTPASSSGSDAAICEVDRLVNGMVHHLAARLKAVARAPDAGTYLAALAFVFNDTGTDER